MVARRRRRQQRRRVRQGVLIYDSSQQRATWSGYIQAHARLREPRGGRVGAEEDVKNGKRGAGGLMVVELVFIRTPAVGGTKGALPPIIIFIFHCSPKSHDGLDTTIV